MHHHHSYWAIWSATLLFFGGFYALLVPLPAYLTAIGFSDWQIGLVLGTFGAAALATRPMIGVAVDALGMRVVLLAGVVALLIGAWGVPITTSLSGLLLLRLLQSVGYVAFTTAGTALVVRLTPTDQRSRQLALFGIAANLAITVTPALVSLLLTALPLSSGFVLSGGLALLAGFLTLLLPPLNPLAAGTRVLRWVPPQVLWRPMLLTGLFGVGFAAFFQFAPILAERRGDVLAGWLYTAYGCGIIVVRLVGGRVLNRLTTRHALLIAMALKAVGLGLIATAPPVPLLVLAVLLVAAGSGVFHPVLLAYHALLLPNAPGQATAAFYLGFDLGLGAGSWLLGVLLQVAGLNGLYTGAALLVLLAWPLVVRVPICDL